MKPTNEEGRSKRLALCDDALKVSVWRAFFYTYFGM